MIFIESSLLHHSFIWVQGAKPRKPVKLNIRRTVSVVCIVLSGCSIIIHYSHQMMQTIRFSIRYDNILHFCANINRIYMYIYNPRYFQTEIQKIIPTLDGTKRHNMMFMYWLGHTFFVCLIYQKAYMIFRRTSKEK